MKGYTSAMSLNSTNGKISKTLMPFLYQTRTLSVFRTRAGISSKSHQADLVSNRRFLHSTRSVLYKVAAKSDNDIPVRQPPSPYEGPIQSDEGHTGDRIPIRRVGVTKTWKEGKEGPSVPWDWEDSPLSADMGKEELMSERDGIPFDIDETADGANFSFAEDSFADDDIFGDVTGDSNGPELSKSADRPERESTITIAERHAFQRIFADILTRSRTSNNDHVSPHLPTSHASAINASETSRGRKATDALDSVMSKAMTQGTKSAKSFDSRRPAKTQEELRADVERYPLPLRAAAAKALGLVSEQSPLPTQEDSTSMVDDLEPVRQPERERVEALMREAETDIELWQVMEKEVFSLVARFGLEETKNQDKKNQKRKKGKLGSTKKAEDSQNSTTNSSEPLDLTVYGPLYPSHLLLGLRLLDRSFAKPSSLVLNVLPRIKSLGIISHVLGASVALYNELLRIYWYRYDDFHGVEKLLAEMDHSGLDLNSESLAIIADIYRMRQSVRRGEKGPVLQALWQMPEFAKARLIVREDQYRPLLQNKDLAL